MAGNAVAWVYYFLACGETKCKPTVVPTSGDRIMLLHCARRLHEVYHNPNFGPRRARVS